MTRPTSRDLALGAAGLFAAFLALTLYVRHGGTIPGDAHLWNRYRTGGVPSAPVADLRQFFSALGTPVVAAATTLVAAAVAGRRLGSRAAATVLVTAAVVVLEAPIADLVGRTRAAVEVGFPAGGYPSGHAVYATAVFGIVATLGIAEVRAVAIVLWAGMVVTRVTSGAHLLDEVLGGILLGGAWLCLVLAVSRRGA